MHPFRTFWFSFCAVLMLGATGLRAGDWRETLTRAPGNFPPLRPLTAHYEFGWSGFKAAETDTTFSKKGGRLQLDITGRTTGFARGLWKMDTKATSTCNASTLRPIKLQQVETYSGKTLTTTVNYTAEGPETLRVPNPPDPTAPKVKKFKFAPVYDLHSALLFVRSQPLKNGETTRLCVFPAGSPYLAEVTVVRRETVNVAGKKWNAIRCELKLQSVQKDFSLQPHKRFKKATAWISDDADRLLLKLDAEIFVGHIWLELDKVEFAKK